MIEMHTLDKIAVKTSQLPSLSLTQMSLSSLLYFAFYVEFLTEVKPN